jgi:hypothetical protein
MSRCQHEHFDPRDGDSWCDALDRAYGQLAERIAALEQQLAEQNPTP